MPEAGDFIQNSYTKKLVTYFLNSDYRKAVALQPWIYDLVEEGSDISGTPGACDTAAINGLRAVFKDILYVGDMQKWKLAERWQTPLETGTMKDGDCEDGAILLYYMLRKAGVPANRLMLFAGYATDPRTGKDSGHCWLGYRPEEYPLNWAFLDWCYFPRTERIESRNLFYVNGQAISEFKPDGSPVDTKDKKYKSMWFCFNEETSFLKLDWRPSRA